MITKKSLLYSLGTTILFSIPLTIMLWSVIFFITDKARRDIEIMATQSGKMVGAYIDLHVRQFSLLAMDQTITNKDLPMKTRLASVEPYQQINRVQNIFIINNDGYGISTDGEQRSFAKDEYFNTAINGKPAISGPLSFPGEKNQLFETAVPLRSRRSTVGVIIQYSPWDAINDLVDSISFGNNGYAYITDQSASFLERNTEASPSKKLQSIAPIPGTTWSLVITVFTEDVLSKAWVLYLLYGILIGLSFLKTNLYFAGRFKLENENKRMIDELAKNKIDETDNRYRNLFETMSSGAVLHEILRDNTGKAIDARYISINSMAEKMFTIEREKILGKQYTELFPNPDMQWIETLGEIESSKAVRALENSYTPEGKIMRNIAYSPASGQVVILYDDITEEIMAKRALELEREKLITTTNAAEEGNRTKSRFLANMSHEIRTPLNAIIGLAEIEIELHKDPLIERTFTAIQESAKNLMKLLNDILDYSTMESGKITLERIEFPLEEVLQNAIAVTTPRLNGKKVEMLVNIDPELPAHIIGDPARFGQIVSNLLDNAGKFTDNGQIIMDVESAPDSHICIRVSDTGIGLTAEQKNLLFTAFEKGDSDQSPHRNGTGLGLSIAKQLVEMMHGSITVESEEGNGAIFTVILPVETARNTPTTLGFIEEAKLLKDRSILVAEDDPIARKIISNLLENLQIRAVCVPSGEEALAQIITAEANGTPFDLYILDYIMPGMNGITTANEIAHIVENKPKLLMITAWSHNLIMNDIMNAGFIDVIDKPFVPSSFIQKIASALGLSAKKGSWPFKKNHEQYAESKVLIVEDNAQNRDVMNRMLFLFGIRPDIAYNGQEAVEKTENKDFDLVLMDIQMPEMNGLEAARAIRIWERENNRPVVPIVAMTAYAMTEDIQKSLQAGMNAHIAKPIEIAALRRILGNFLGNKKTAHVSEQETKKTEFDKGPTLAKITCIDMEQGLARLGGDVKLYTRLLVGLKKILASPQPEFELAVSSVNIAETAHFVHTLKGLAGNLSVPDLYRLTSEFNDSLRINQADKESYEAYRAQCVAVYAELNAKIPEDTDNEGEAQELPEGTEAELASALEMLIEPLETGNAPAAIAILDSLRKKQFVRISPPELEEFRRLATTYEFGKILEKIRQSRIGVRTD